MSKINEVIKKNMQFIMPKAKLALSMAHVLLVLICRPLDPLTPFGPRDTENTPFPLKVVQLAWDILRNSYTPAMKAPTKQRSMKETKMADSRVDFRRKRVTMAQTAPRTETMNRVLQEEDISSLSLSLWRCLDMSVQDVARGKLIGFCEFVDKVCLEAVSKITMTARIMEYIGICTYEHAQCRYEGNDFQKAPEGEEKPGNHNVDFCG